MLRVECINDTNASALEVGKVYYAFPAAANAAYISRFPNKNAHTGCYQLSRFVETNKPASDFYKAKPKPPLSEFQKGHFYVAKLKSVPDKYNPYCDVYAITDELLAVYEDTTFEMCIGTIKSTSVDKISEVSTPVNQGKVILFPAAIKYGWLMDRPKRTDIVFQDNSSVIAEQAQTVESITDKTTQYEQLSLF